MKRHIVTSDEASQEPRSLPANILPAADEAFCAGIFQRLRRKQYSVSVILELK
ncbi:hypothetical protein [Paenibacillus sp. sgz302251]|uniref:hypothetical protein n=1 Tax=Paenibacillus sp. sgz302251 TaxID=3414493 RepID=UPI003C7C9BAF